MKDRLIFSNKISVEQKYSNEVQFWYIALLGGYLAQEEDVEPEPEGEPEPELG